MEKKKSLNLLNSLQQIFYWSGYCGVGSFVVSLLLSKGFNTSTIGAILFCTNFFSFLIQPFFGSLTDKSKSNVIQRIILFATLFSCCGFMVIYLFELSSLLIAILYVASQASIDMQQSLLNSETVYYTSRGWKINYGMGRAVGSLGYSFTSIAIGYLIKDFGGSIVILLSVSLFLINGILSISFPKDDTVPDDREYTEPTSLFVFIGKYKWFFLSLFGITLLSMVHLMLENYLIEVFKLVGGDSSNVGKSLFLATTFATPIYYFFPKIQKKLGSFSLFVIPGIAYAIKALLFFFAKSVWYIYVGEVLQMITYAFMSPNLLYYAKHCISDNDMAKGQAMGTAMYSMGCAFGNLLGGVLISVMGTRLMNLSAAGIAVLGTLIFLIAVPKAMKN